jgi:multiple sugar transport system ATP-binding protein
VAEVVLKALAKSFGSSDILRSIDLSIADGEFAVFVGPSGCGKSTTLRLIAGLEAPTAGEIWIGGERADRLAPAARQVAMVFQNYALYPHMTVAQNMGFALKVAGQSRSQVAAAVNRAAETLRIAHLLERMPAELSGGERQRVAIGRAIVREPRVFLFDEPLSNLDAALRVEMRLELQRLHETLGTTMIYVTHDQTEAMTLGQRVALFNRGRVVQFGAPLDLFTKPVNQFAARFLGSPPINLLPVRWLPDARAWQIASITLASAVFGGPHACPDPARAAVLGVRPENWLLASSGEEGLGATVRRCEHLGDSVLVHVDVDGLPDSLCLRRAADQQMPSPGEPIRLTVAAAATHWFDASEQRL